MRPRARPGLGLFISAVLACAVYPATVQAETEIPIPDDAQLSVVGDALHINGIPMQIYELRSPQSMREVLDFYRQRWAGEIAESKLSGWLVLSHRQDDDLLTVQLSTLKGRGSFGYIAISPAFSSNLRVEQRKLELPPGSEVLSDLQAVDRGRSSHTIVYRNRMSVAQNIRWHENHYERKGWNSNYVGSGKSGRTDGTQNLLMSKRGGELNLVVNGSAQQSHGTLVLVEP